ncbi:MAG: thioesterase II family protein [Pseudonocardiaceae bacterium]
MTTNWIRRFHPAPDAPRRLVCFPHAGGSAKYFLPVSRSLSPATEVLALQYPGRHDRHGEPGIDDLVELAVLIVDVLRPWADRPLTFFGHSMGATLAFEVARRLASQHTELTGLFVSARCAPSRHRDERSHQLDDEGLLAAVRQLTGASAELPGFERFARRALPVIRSDYTAAETYRYTPGPDVTCPIFALLGDRDPMVTVAEAQWWRVHTSGAFELRLFPGGHFYLDGQWAAVLDLLERHLMTCSTRSWGDRSPTPRRPR